LTRPPIPPPGRCSSAPLNCLLRCAWHIPSMEGGRLARFCSVHGRCWTAARRTLSFRPPSCQPGAHGRFDPMEDPAQMYSGSVPALYDRYRGPVFFEPFARDLADCLADLRAGNLLEIAAGTGIVTRVLARVLPATVSIIASDINQAMLDFAAAQPGLARISWRQADALALPFDDASFDAVLCQFGVMFFPDRVAGYREARRVLKPGGRFLFSVWDRLEHNPVSRCVIDGLATWHPRNPPRFLARTPHGHHDTDVIRREIAAAGFGEPTIQTVTLTCRAPSALDPAIGFCQGSPMRGEIEALDASGLEAATEAAAAAIRAEFGNGPIEAPMQALVVTARKT